MEDMTKEEVQRFLLETPRTGHVATVREDGSPHAAPVWYTLDIREDDFDLLFTTWHTTVKAANLRHDSRVAVTVDDPEPPYSFVLIQGRAEISGDLDELRRWATRIGGRYMGEDQAEAFGKRNGVPGELLVRVRVDKIVAKKRIAD